MANQRQPALQHPRALLLVAGAALLGAACTAPAGAGPTPEVSTTVPSSVDDQPAAEQIPEISALPDVTARPLSIEELTLMLPIGDTGVAATNGDPLVSERSNEDLVTTAVLDREDESEDVLGFGRVTGVAASYPASGYEAHVWIDLFNDVEGAKGWIGDTAGDITKRLGGSHHPAINLTDAVEFPIEGVGEDAIGLVLSLDEGERHETVTLFRMGRLVVFASVVRSDDADARVPVQYLAEEVADRLLVVLLGTGSDVEVRAGGPSGYSFEYERIVTIGDQQWPTTAVGRVYGSDVSCRVRVEQPELTLDREYVSAGGTVWTRWPGQSDYETRGSAGALDAMLLSLCPAWPLHVADAGLMGALEGAPARYEVGGAPALGYRGTGEDLVSALGEALGDATVDVFNVWIAEGSSWLIELDLSVSGSTDQLTELIGPGYAPGEAAQVLVRHQVSDIDAVDPITAPG